MITGKERANENPKVVDLIEVALDSGGEVAQELDPKDPDVGNILKLIELGELPGDTSTLESYRVLDGTCKYGQCKICSFSRGGKKTYGIQYIPGEDTKGLHWMGWQLDENDELISTPYRFKGEDEVVATADGLEALGKLSPKIDPQEILRTFTTKKTNEPQEKPENPPPQRGMVKSLIRKLRIGI